MDSEILLFLFNAFLLETLAIGAAANGGKCVHTIDNSSGLISLGEDFTEAAAAHDESLASCRFRFVVPAGHLVLVNVTQLDGDRSGGGGSGKHCTPRINVKDSSQSSAVCARDLGSRLPLLLRSSGPDFRISVKWTPSTRVNFAAHYHLIQLQDTPPSCVYTCNFRCLDSIGAVCSRPDICDQDTWQDICRVYLAGRRREADAVDGSQTSEQQQQQPPPPEPEHPSRFVVMSYILAVPNDTTTLRTASTGTMAAVGAAEELAEALGADSLPVVIILVSALIALALMCTVLALTLRHAHKRACQRQAAATATATATATSQSSTAASAHSGPSHSLEDGQEAGGGGSSGVVRGHSIKVESELMDQQRKSIMTRSPATRNYPATICLPGEATPPYHSLMSLNVAGGATGPNQRDNELCRQIVCAPPNVVVGQNSVYQQDDGAQQQYGSGGGQARVQSHHRHCRPTRPQEVPPSPDRPDRGESEGPPPPAVLGGSPSADLTQPLLPLPLLLLPTSHPPAGNQANGSCCLGQSETRGQLKA